MSMLLESCRTVFLTDVCEFVGGTQPPKSKFKNEPGEGLIRLLQIRDFEDDSKAVFVDQKHRLKTCEDDDILIARYGASLGRILRGKSGAYNVALCKASPKQDVLTKDYLYWTLRSSRFQRFLQKVGSRSAQAGFNKDNLSKFELKLPPLEEQRRIAEILDLADGLRAKRREALAEVEELTQAVFLEMFCRDNEFPWEEVDSLAKDKKSAIRTGPFGSQLLHSEFVDEGIPVLGIDNAVENRFMPGKPRFITPLKYKKLKRYTVYPGDVLITIMGTCGRCAIVPDDIGTAINTKHLCCITLDKSRCLSTYFKNCFLCHPAVLSSLGVQTRGAVMPGLNMGIIKKLKIPVPPLILQKEFAERVKAIEKLKASHQRSLEEMDALFASLQSRAFKGEL